MSASKQYKLRKRVEMDLIKSKCACGASIEVKIETPKRFQHSVKTTECPGCKSRYLFTCEIDPTPGPIKFNVGVKALDITEKAIEATKAAMNEETAAV